ncbi:MAG: hypothetical protein IV107_09795 [Paucibacter sp.]|nr:hypothetical protein [Roseateles sp.]
MPICEREYPFEFVFRGPGRVEDLEWEVIEPRYADFWKSAAKSLRRRTYEHKGCDIEIRVDWSPLVRRIVRDHNLMTPVRSGGTANPSWYKKISQPLRIKALCTVSGSNEISEYAWYSGFFMEYFLYEIFAIANLACPGSAEFYGLSIVGGDTKTTSELRLSAFYFDEWMIESIQGLHMGVRLIDPEIVDQWFKSVNPRITQKAENSTQRAIFALFHLCKSDGHVDFILWIFNALEALLSTRVGENFSGLVRRASLVLELNPKQTAELSKRMRKLYDLRSSFVHGGYDVPHPIHSETIDRRLDDHYSNEVALGKYGFFVLVSLFQRMIEKNLASLLFEEKLMVAQNAI